MNHGYTMTFEIVHSTLDCEDCSYWSSASGDLSKAAALHSSRENHKVTLMMERLGVMAETIICAICAEHVTVGFYYPTLNKHRCCACFDPAEGYALALFVMSEWQRRGRPYDGAGNPLVIT